MEDATGKDIIAIVLHVLNLRQLLDVHMLYVEILIDRV